MKRKRAYGGEDAGKNLIEVIDIESDNEHVFCIPRGTQKSPICVEEYTDRRGISKKNPILVEQYIGRRSGTTDKNPISVEEIRVCCEICTEAKPGYEFFDINGCAHSYCSECMVRYVEFKIQESVVYITCPEPKCEGVLDPETCRSILPTQLFDRWCRALCESMIPGDQKFYCPFKDCSALLVNDCELVAKKLPCPHCNRLFCAQCRAPWHTRLSCKKYKEANETEQERDERMMVFFKKKKWQRCPNCKFYVERNNGCPHMICRCKYEFCYKCGGPRAHGGSDHVCVKPEKNLI